MDRLGGSTGNRLGYEDPVLCGDVGQILQCEDWNGGIELRLVAGRKDQFDLRIAYHAQWEIRSGPIVHGNSDSSAKQASPEGSDQFRGIRRPQKNALIRAKAVRFQGICEEQRVGGEPVVGPGNLAISVGVDECTVTLEAFEIGEEREQRFARHGRYRSARVESGAGTACPALNT